MFEIRFQGLITHAEVEDLNGKAAHRAVIYNVPAMPHIARLTVQKKDWDEGSSARPDNSSNDARCYTINGLIQTSLGAGVPKNHLNGVFSLTNQLATGSILKPVREIRALQPTDAFSLVETPGGTLFVQNWFRDQALLPHKMVLENGDIVDGPAVLPTPRTIVLSTYASGNVTFTLYDRASPPNARKVVLTNKNAEVYITNFPEPTSPPTTMAMPHFDIMANFFDQTTPVTVANPPIVKQPPFILGGEDEQHDTCAGSHELSVECSNTQFP